MKVVKKCAVLALVLFGTSVMAQSEAAEVASHVKNATIAVAAALTMFMSVIGAGLALGKIGAAALGAAAEKPELLSKSMLFLALAEGLCVLGFVIAIMLVQKIA